RTGGCAAGRGARGRLAVRPAGARDLSGGLRDDDLGRRRQRAAGGRPPGAPGFSPPPVREFYREGSAPRISAAGASEPLEGAHRGPGHFQGVATVVCKLLNIVAPDVAYFGAKDAQQVTVVRGMVPDLGTPPTGQALPPVPAADARALSSRNALLSAA